MTFRVQNGYISIYEDKISSTDRSDILLSNFNYKDGNRSWPERNRDSKELRLRSFEDEDLYLANNKFE